MPNHKTLVSAAACLAAALTCVAAPTPSAVAATSPKCPPGLGIGLTEVSAALAHDPRARRYVTDFVRPGTSFSRKVLVCNGDSGTIQVRMYTVGARIVGGNFTLNQAPAVDAVSQWVSIAPSQFALAAGESRVVEATIAVPSDAAAGEFYGGIVASRPAQGGSLGVTARAAVRVYLAVGTGGLPPTNFRIDSMTAARNSDGSPYVLAQVTNTGKRAIDLSGNLKLTKGPGGLSAGPFPARLGTTLAPGQSEPVTIPLDKALPAGPWLATLDMKSGLLERKAQATITFPTGDGAKAAPVKAKSVPLTKNRDVIVPIAILLLLFLLILLLLIWWRRRKRDDDDEQRLRS